MENVPEVVGAGNIQHFKKWEQRLREFGYSNYVEILNAKDYGIPQNRRRCFMISILGDYSYDFPCKMPLKYRLKDLLETDVDEKYYLDKNTINRISKWKSYQNPLDDAIDIETEQEKVMSTITTRVAESCDGGMSASMKLIKEYGNKALNETLLTNSVEDGDYIDAYNRSINKKVAGTITTGVSFRNESFVADNKVNVVGNYGNGHHAKDVIDSDGLMNVITTGNHGLGQTIAIKNNDSKGYAEASDGDGIDISGRMQYHRGDSPKRH